MKHLYLQISTPERGLGTRSKVCRVMILRRRSQRLEAVSGLQTTLVVISRVKASSSRRPESQNGRFATETACLTMRDYMIGSNPNVFSMLGEDFHPDLLALIVKELLRLIGREFSKRRFLKLNKKIPGVKRALELPAKRYGRSAFRGC